MLTVLRPDLTVPTVTFTPAAITPGANITVTSRGEEPGPGSGQRPAVCLALAALDRPDRRRPGRGSGDGQRAGDHRGGHDDGDAVGDGAAGPRPGSLLRAGAADDPDAIVEPNSGNNLGFSAARLTVGPDMTVTTASTVTGGIPGANVRVTYTLKNLGSASAPFSVGFTLVPILRRPRHSDRAHAHGGRPGCRRYARHQLDGPGATQRGGGAIPRPRHGRPGQHDRRSARDEQHRHDRYPDRHAARTQHLEPDGAGHRHRGP